MTPVVRTSHIQTLIASAARIAEAVDHLSIDALVLVPEHPNGPVAVVDALEKAASNLRHAAEELTAERLGCFGWTQQ